MANEITTVEIQTLEELSKRMETITNQVNTLPTGEDDPIIEFARRETHKMLDGVNKLSQKAMKYADEMMASAVKEANQSREVMTAIEGFNKALEECANRLRKANGK